MFGAAYDVIRYPSNVTWRILLMGLDREVDPANHEKSHVGADANIELLCFT